MSLINRYDFVLLFDVKDGNPNGDPDAGNTYYQHWLRAIESLVRDKMGGAYPLDVPLEVSVGYGRSWDTAAH